jgi:DNA topoisomerase-2
LIHRRNEQLTHNHFSSLEVDEDSEEDYVKPAVKKKKITQAPVTDFFGKIPEPKKAVARKPSSSKPALAKKTVAKKGNDDDISIESDSDIPPAPRAVAPKRAARVKSKKYVEVGSGSEADDVSMFEDN